MSNNWYKKSKKDNRIEKAFDSFKFQFDEMDLQLANKLIYDLIKIAQLNSQETQRFMNLVRREMNSKNIELDIAR